MSVSRRVANHVHRGSCTGPRDLAIPVIVEACWAAGALEGRCKLVLSSSSGKVKSYSHFRQEPGGGLGAVTHKRAKHSSQPRAATRYTCFMFTLAVTCAVVCNSADEDAPADSLVSVHCENLSA